MENKCIMMEKSKVVQEQVPGHLTTGNVQGRYQGAQHSPGDGSHQRKGSPLAHSSPNFGF